MSQTPPASADIERAIRNVPDFPKPGIQFKDITPVLADALLPVQRRTLRLELHRQGDERHGRREQDESGKGEREIDGAAARAHR